LTLKSGNNKPAAAIDFHVEGGFLRRTLGGNVCRFKSLDP
jgi:hypothetical protein